MNVSKKSQLFLIVFTVISVSFFATIATAQAQEMENASPMGNVSGMPPMGNPSGMPPMGNPSGMPPMGNPSGMPPMGNDAQRRFDEAKAAREQAEQKVTELETAIEEAKQALTLAENNEQDAKKAYDDEQQKNKEQIIAAKKAVEDAQQQLDTVQRELDEARKALAEAEGVVKTAETQTTDATQALNDAKATLAALKGEPVPAPVLPPGDGPPISSPSEYDPIGDAEVMAKLSRTDWNGPDGKYDSTGAGLAEIPQKVLNNLADGAQAWAREYSPDAPFGPKESANRRYIIDFLRAYYDKKYKLSLKEMAPTFGASGNHQGYLEGNDPAVLEVIYGYGNTRHLLQDPSNTPLKRPKAPYSGREDLGGLSDALYKEIWTFIGNEA